MRNIFLLYSKLITEPNLIFFLFKLWFILNKNKGFYIIEAKRNINANGKKRGKVEEVIITNFENNKGF